MVLRKRWRRFASGLFGPGNITTLTMFCPVFDRCWWPGRLFSWSLIGMQPGGRRDGQREMGDKEGGDQQG